MSLDVSDAIALAKDLLRTSNDFRAHDLELADQFAGRAYEICDDLGIDRGLIGDVAVTTPDEPPVDDDGDGDVVELTAAEAIDEEARQTSQQLRNLLEQQARVVQNTREAGSFEEPKAAKRSFNLFGWSRAQTIGGLQSA